MRLGSHPRLVMAAVLTLLLHAGARSQIVISQVYTTGGTAGATWRNDYVELFNQGPAPVDVTGWTVQFSGPGSPSWALTAITGVIDAGEYYLVQEASGGPNGAMLPAPDASGPINLTPANGKVALVSHAAPLSGLCPLPDPAIVDFVGYGPSSGCFEGAGPAPSPGSPTMAIHRVGNGCADTGNNTGDFMIAPAVPRNSATTPAPCSTPSGACCIGVDCSIETPSACALASGTYHGDGSVCTPSLCNPPPPTGACCNGTTCTIKTQSDCAASFGTYLGDNTPCGGSTCAFVSAPCEEPPTWETPPASPCAESACGIRADAGSIHSTYLAQGEFYLTAVDLRIRGRGLDFVWARKYRSRCGPNTAQGNQWDFSYNIYLEQIGPNLVLNDGNSRTDLYTLQANGKWARDGFFREIEDHVTEIWLVFADTSKWIFNPIAGNPQPSAGKIKQIVDRNGNTMSFTYNPQGRLQTITDSLNRQMQITYNANNLISTVSDFTGRQVVYTYYDGVEAGGNLYDLKSARSPGVAGTPNGNDFINGKTTTYTYSTGLAHPSLNRNLLTVKDARNQIYLANTYAATTNAEDVLFDRLVGQQWGGPGANITVAYTPQAAPGESNSDAVMKAAVTDRNGNVKHYYYDAMNRLVVARELTRGLRPADPPSWPGEPAYWETRWTYNVDSLPGDVTYPNLNVTSNVYELELNPTADRRRRGNLRERHRSSGPLGGDQTVLTELFEYETGFGGCGCGTNFVRMHIDARGNTTSHTYDIHGNRTHTDHRTGGGVEDWTYNNFGQVLTHTLPANGDNYRRMDAYEYYGLADGAQNGYLKSETISDGSQNLKTTYEYDARGNVTRHTAPRGNDTGSPIVGQDTLYTYNDLDQVVRQRSRVVSGSTLRYETRTWYDANNNVVRVDVENRNEQGTLDPANPHLSTIYEYDILDRRIRTCQEKDGFNLGSSVVTCGVIPPTHVITTEYDYDANGNPIRTRTPQALAAVGAQPNNTVDTEYDERNLVFKSIRCKNDAELKYTTRTDYDGNGNVVRVTAGLEDAQPRMTLSTYDGYNRLMTTTDPMGNVTLHHYDANGNPGGNQAEAPPTPNPFAMRVMGELVDVPGAAGNVRLSETQYQYDAMDRRIRADVAHFDAQTQAAIGDGQSTTQTLYAHNSQVTSVTDDRGNTTLTFYDTANRRISVVDAKGNIVNSDYDANSNLTAITEIEFSDLNNPTQYFRTTCDYDGLDRRVWTTDNAGNAVYTGYDSRGNVVRTVDATPAHNQVGYTYDGLDRLIRTVYDMDGDGPDATTGADADIVTDVNYNANSLVTTQADDKSHATAKTFDARNQSTQTDFADCPNESRTYDRHGNLLSDFDQNGTQIDYTYDLLNRVTQKLIAPGASVAGAPEGGTTTEFFQYDGLGRLVYAANNNSAVSRAYDSLGGVTSETLDGATTTALYNGMGNQTQLTYPGGRIVTTTYDQLNRKQSINDNQFGLIATYAYIGPSRVERRTYGNDTRCDYEYDGFSLAPGGPAVNPFNDFSVKKIVRTKHQTTGGVIIDHRTYTWDPMGNKTSRRDERTEAGAFTLQHTYIYDPVYRLTHTTVTNWFTPGPAVRDTTYTLDGVGNRLEVSDPGSGTPDQGAYHMEPLCFGTEWPPADDEMNQYTRTAFDARTYDKNGNTTARRQTGGKDFDGDGDVDTADLALFVVCATRAGVPQTLPECLRRDPDFDDDGDVDHDDFGEWQRCYSGPGVPAGIACGGPTHRMKYDYANRMVRFEDVATGRINTYSYDALGRRIRKVVNATGVDGTPVETRFYLDGWQEVEERNGAGATTGTYVYGLYVDEVLQLRRGPGPAANLFYHADDLYNVMAITNAITPTPAVSERYEYDDYGAPRIFAPNGTPRANSIFGNPSLFQGRRYDAETALYYYRTRYLDPRAGRFTTRDTIGIWGDESNAGNAYVYVNNGPASALDPFGMGAPEEKPVIPPELTKKVTMWAINKHPVARGIVLMAKLGAETPPEEGARMVGTPNDDRNLAGSINETWVLKDGIVVDLTRRNGQIQDLAGLMAEVHRERERIKREKETARREAVRQQEEFLKPFRESSYEGIIRELNLGYPVLKPQDMRLPTGDQPLSEPMRVFMSKLTNLDLHIRNSRNLTHAQRAELDRIWKEMMAGTYDPNQSRRPLQ